MNESYNGPKVVKQHELSTYFMLIMKTHPYHKGIVHIHQPR